MVRIFSRTPLFRFRRKHREGVRADSRYWAFANCSFSFAVFLTFQNPMSGIPVSIRLQKEPLTCPQCGSASRIGRSRCLSCLLAQGLRGRLPLRLSDDTLVHVLGELAVQAAAWRRGDYQVLDEVCGG